MLAGDKAVPLPSIGVCFHLYLCTGTIANVSKQQINQKARGAAAARLWFLLSLFEAESICNHFPVFTELLMIASSWNLLLVLAHSDSRTTAAAGVSLIVSLLLGFAGVTPVPASREGEPGGGCVIWLQLNSRRRAKSGWKEMEVKRD